VKSETLGEGCAENLLETLESNATVDEHMLDQILPYMAVADGTSTIMTEEVTGHADTNLWVIERILGDLFTVEKKGKLVQVTKD
jgi:RNA 3'-terminal phosphate cyclase